MNRATLQTRINAGLGIAARVLGTQYQLYRPQNLITPLTASIATVQGAVVRDASYDLRTPAGFGESRRYWLGDSSALQVGDFLVGDGETLFVAAMPANTPVLLIDCNDSLQVSNWVSASGYGGAVETVLASGWPASVRLSGHGDVVPTALPGDRRSAGWEILLPALPGLSLLIGMHATSASGRRLVLSGVESSGLGYRILASYGGN